MKTPKNILHDCKLQFTMKTKKLNLDTFKFNNIPNNNALHKISENKSFKPLRTEPYNWCENKHTFYLEKTFDLT